MTPHAHPRILTDDLLLLAYRPDTGRPLVDGNRLQCALAGALIAEAVLAGLVALDGGGRLQAAGRHRTGDTDVDGLAARVAAEPKPRKIKWWVQKLNKGAQRQRLLGRAVSVGALSREASRVLGIFPVDNYRPAQPGSRDEAAGRVRAVLLGHPAPDARTVALLALVGAAGLDGKLFADVPRGDRRRAIKAVVARDDIGRAVREVIQSIEGAVAATIAASGAAAAGGGS
ncbi:GPP34 family phosphoprotein [Streptomonospora sp. PA3]|uniref:GOLPH3/VPS74 family protein n=1 Tax=Streptomonospora sp. PA3 TaxID=2607326 RepID=UPI0012DCF4FF|nr:GPP34 family phosphoprotein [Streptomonospora sp. PA3]MUL43948.1 GPP34 family phosphoprotein [Streptomonospora sp. PA3]